MYYLIAICLLLGNNGIQCDKPSVIVRSNIAIEADCQREAEFLKGTKPEYKNFGFVCVPDGVQAPHK